MESIILSPGSRNENPGETIGVPTKKSLATEAQGEGSQGLHWHHGPGETPMKNSWNSWFDEWFIDDNQLLFFW